MSKAALVIFCAVLIVFSSSSLARNINESLSEPTVVAAVASVLPPIARQARVESDVKVEVKIDEKGNVQSAKVISGHPLVSKASETAAKKWKFSPLDQKTSVRTVQLTFSFDCVDLEKLAPDSTITFIPPYAVEVKY
jgi:TonB family protein